MAHTRLRMLRASSTKGESMLADWLAECGWGDQSHVPSTASGAHALPDTSTVGMLMTGRSSRRAALVDAMIVCFSQLLPPFINTHVTSIVSPILI
jgi:hypothetical protein